jgi:ribosomal protein L6P/L9E
MTTVAGPRLLNPVSIRQLYKNTGRYVRQSPSCTRVTPPRHRIRAPATPGVGVFFYPPDEWEKKMALATGPLGCTHETIHSSKFQIIRSIHSSDESGRTASPELVYWGLGGAVRVVKNLLSGVAEGFAVNLELHGVGYRAEADEAANKLILRLGLSHTVEFPLDDGEVFFRVPSPQLVQVAGINRGKVHQRASAVRAMRPPEPYKGKGVRYQLEPVRRKQSKKDS